MSATKTEIRRGAYYDSVVLMQLQRNLLKLSGVEDAGVVMATPANLELLAESQLSSKEATASKPEDLLIVVRGKTSGDAEAALAQVDELLKKRSSAAASDFRPKSLSAAVRNNPEAEWVLISVPGRYAASVADEALDLGRHVFLYSDNVSVEDEVRLKTKALKQNLIVMGPDCGTAIINGIGLGFANHVNPGNIGLVAASGTGLQAVSVGIHNLGGGISQAFGTGGRDLKAGVGAITMQQCLAFLAADPSTDVIVLVSKPPDDQTAANLLAAARQINKPIVVSFLGYAPPAERIGNLHFAGSLDHTARLAVDLANIPTTKDKPTAIAKPGFLRGLFSGGTLASQVFLGLSSLIKPIYSNMAMRSEQKLPDTPAIKGHTIVDLGEDEFTVGRLHPMMDNDLRIRQIKQGAAERETSLILLDVVLGEGSHPDPSSELAPVIAEQLKKSKDLEFVVLLVGTDADPQDLKKQQKSFSKAGAHVVTTASEAVDYVSACFAQEQQEATPVPTFSSSLAAINVGVESFYDSLVSQGVEAMQVDWRPPAAGNAVLMGLLERMKD